MMLALPVSAGSKIIVVPDRIGDISKNYYWDTGEPRHGWGDKTPVVEAGCFDVVSAWLAEKGGTYTFGMMLAGDLPLAGGALPCGITSASWNMFIESAGPWNPNNPLPFAYIIMLAFDGSSYSATMVDVSVGITTPLRFMVDESVFQMKFSADSIGDRSTFWWSFDVEVIFGAGGWSMPDNPDPGASPGQVYWDVPWPSA